MKAKFRSSQSPTPCFTCGHYKKGTAGLFCGRLPKQYINFEKYRGRIKHHDNSCRFSDHKEIFIYPCISLWNPWAWAVLYAGKDIENRTMKWNYRGEFLIHAAKKRLPDSDWEDLQLYFKTKFKVDLPDMDQLNFGGIVGKAEIIDCVTQSDSPWYEVGKKGWLLRNQKRIKFIPFRGQQGIFKYHSNLKL